MEKQSTGGLIIQGRRFAPWRAATCALASIGLLTGTAVNAAERFWDLNDSSVTNELIIRGSADGGKWAQEDDGNGHIQITGAVDGQFGTILFPDFDDGLVVKAFTFEALIKLGDGENPPADGFSLNYASISDPVIVDILAGGNGEGFAGSQDNGGTENNLREEGTTTGLGIGFDTWGAPGGGNGETVNGVNRDLRGISIRVNGVQAAQIPLPTLLVTNPQGDPADPTSLETGTAGGGTGTNLTWQPLRVELDELGVINVFWKGVQVLTNYSDPENPFFPIPGRLVFSGRTGGNHAYQLVDDIRIVTIPSETFLISGLAGRADGFEIIVNDAQGSELDPDTIALQLNGTPLDSSTYTVAKVGSQSTITYSTLPDFFDPGVTNLVSITAQDQNGLEAELTRPFVVRPYVQLDADWIAGAGEYDTASPGFEGEINQIAIGRFPGDANNAWNAMRHLAGGYIDPATGNAYANLVDPAAGVNADGTFSQPDELLTFDPFFNWNQDAGTGQAGQFTTATGFSDALIPGIPGTTGGTDNIVMSAYSYLELEGPKLYTFVVNSDDGFRVSFGPDVRSALFTAPGGASTSPIAGQFNGGKGSSDVQFDVVVPEGGSGVYLSRLLWWEGGGGANLEFFSIEDGVRALVGDTANGGVPAYKPTGGTPPLDAAVVSAAPWPGQTGVPPDASVQIIVADGTGQVVDANSVTVMLNGTEHPKTAVKVGDKSRVTVTPPALLDPGAVYTVDIAYTAGGTPVEESYTFTVVDYPTLPPVLGTAVGTGAEPGMRWRTYQIAVGHGTTIAGAENTLDGTLGPSIHDPAGHSEPEVDGFFPIDFVNFSQDPAAEPSGNFTAGATAPQNVADLPIPGIPGTTGGTDNIAAEALTFLELEPGFYRMVVNSDDGFLVTMGTADVPKHLSLGEFNGGRGASDTVFFFNVETAGVYFFRLLWFEGGGGANVEWFTVDSNGVRSLVGGEQEGSVPAFRTRTVAEPEIPVVTEAEFEQPTLADGQVTLTWTGTGTLQETTDLTNWTDVDPQPTGNTLTVTPEAGVKAYRILVSE